MTPNHHQVGRRILYLLHYENEAGDIWHYAGTTTQQRLNVRLKEHRDGRDTPRTARAKQAGFRIKEIAILADATRLMEHVLSYEHVARYKCPTCVSLGLVARANEPLPRRLKKPTDLADPTERHAP